jgi:alpha-glucosidase
MGLITKIYNSIRFVGLIPTLRTIHYALLRDRQTIKPPLTRNKQANPGKVSEVIERTDGLEFHFQHHQLRLKFMADDVVRVVWEPGSPPPPYAIVDHGWQAPEISIENFDGSWEASSHRLAVRVDREGNIIFFNQDSAVLRKDRTPVFSGENWSQTSELHQKEAVYGLGLRAAPLNLRGKKFRLWNLDPGGSINPGDDPLYICIPVYMGLHPGGNYLVFYENAHDGEINFDQELRIRMSAGALQYYFIAGTPASLLRRYTELTGRPTLPPRWALGYHQSRWGYKSADDIRNVVDGFREHQIPLDNIHLDIDYMRGYRVFTVDQERFPNLSVLTSELQQQGIQTITILDPGVKIDLEYRVYREGLDQDVFIKNFQRENLKALVWPGWCVFPDFTAPKTRTWWGQYYQLLLDQGIAGIWHDMNEPAAFAAWGEPTLSKSAFHELEGIGGTHLAAHNLFGFQMNRAGFEALKELHPEKRPWILSRSGWAGTQRYSWNWTGDVNGTWEMLRQTIPSILGLSISGYYYSGSDIGGFSSHPDKELYIRWFQLAAFTPFFRLHNATGLPSREPWCYDEEVIDIVRDTIQLRRRLIPYWYTLAWQAAEVGKPLIRPLFWLDDENSDLWEIDDMFLVGEQMLVAPILSNGDRKRNILLPLGDWYQLGSDTYHAEPGPLEVDAPLALIPVFIRAGSILPIDNNGQIELHLYPPDTERQDTQESLESQLYLDAGDGYGPSRLETFQLHCRDGVVHIHRTFVGDYQPEQKVYRIVVHGESEMPHLFINEAKVELSNNQGTLIIN